MTSKLAVFVMFSIASMKVLAASARSTPSVSLTSTLVSDYLFRGQRLGGLSIQPAVDLAAGESLAGITANFPLTDTVARRSDPEFDLYASHGFSLNDEWRLSPGFTFYVYPSVPTSAGYHQSLFEPSLALSYTIAGVRTTSTCFYDATRKGPTFELAGAVALPLKTLGTELDLTANLGDYRLRDAFKNARPKKRLSGSYWSLGASVPFQVTSDSCFKLGITFSAGFNSHLKQGAAPSTENPLAARRAIAQVGYSLSF